MAEEQPTAGQAPDPELAGLRARVEALPAETAALLSARQPFAPPESLPRPPDPMTGGAGPGVFAGVLGRLEGVASRLEALGDVLDAGALQRRPQGPSWSASPLAVPATFSAASALGLAERVASFPLGGASGPPGGPGREPPPGPGPGGQSPSAPAAPQPAPASPGAPASPPAATPLPPGAAVPALPPTQVILPPTGQPLTPAQRQALLNQPTALPPGQGAPPTPPPGTPPALPQPASPVVGPSGTQVVTPRGDIPAATPFTPGRPTQLSPGQRAGFPEPPTTVLTGPPGGAAAPGSAHAGRDMDDAVDVLEKILRALEQANRDRERPAGGREPDRASGAQNANLEDVGPDPSRSVGARRSRWTRLH